MHRISNRASALSLAVGLVLAGTAQADVVISQVYGAGGNSGAALRHDFVELHNNGSTAASVDNMSVQYASASGSSWQVAPLTGTIPAGGYYLVRLASSGAVGTELPAYDASGGMNLSGTNGKVALVAGTTALSGTCPAVRVDLVGYGSANCFEGGAAAPPPSPTNAVFRADAGCTDTNQNGADFAAAPAAARNSTTPLRTCAPSALPVLSIADASGAEGDSSTSFSGMLLASLDRPAGPGGVRFRAVTSDGTATAGEDYVGQNWGGVIPEGQTALGFIVPVTGDTVRENDETFVITLSEAEGAVLGDAQGTGTIVNDDFVIVPIHQIQGGGATSPLAGQRVDTVGIVTGRKNNGFFLQSDTPDADPMTSEGVFVFTGSAPPAAAALGNRVRVSGLVIEFVPNQDPGQAPLTEIGGSPVVALLSTPDPQLPAWFALPPAIELDATFPAPDGPLDQLERVEGMRVQLRDATVVAPTQGNTNERDASGSSNGVLHVVAAGLPRPFREPGIQAPDAAPGGGSIPPIPRWDFNPELIAVDSDALGAPRLDEAAGVRISNLAGPLDYGFRRYTLLPDADSPVQVLVARPPETAPRPAEASADPDAFTVAAYNLERFFDTVNDPEIGEPVLNAAAFERRLAKASLAIRDYLNTPDILGTVEVESLAVLQTLADRINADAVAAGQPDPRYTAHLLDGNDVGGIDVGFLVKTANVADAMPRIAVHSVAQVGKDTLWNEPDGSASLLNDRPPLALDATVHYADGRAFPLGVVLVHQRSLNGAETDDAAGERVRSKRQRQAEFLAAYLQGRQEREPGTRLVVLGDFNAFEFNDGLVDAMNVVTGTPTPDEQTAVLADGADLVNPDLVNLGGLEPAHERYSFVFGGNAQTLDHVLVNETLVVDTREIHLDHARINADFPEINRNDAASPSRLSDHDPVVATFVPRRRADLVLTAVATGPARIGQTFAFDVVLRNEGPEQADRPGVGFEIDAEIHDLAVNAPTGWNCDAPRLGDGRTALTCFGDALAFGADGTFTLSATATPALVGRTLRLAAAAEAESRDPQPDNNGATATLDVTALADLRVALDGPAKHLRSGTRGAYRAVIGNAGPDLALAPVLTLIGDVPARNVRLIVPSGWACPIVDAAAGFRASCTAEQLAPGETRAFGFSIVAPPRTPDRTITVSARISATVEDAAPENDEVVHSVRVIGSPK